MNILTKKGFLIYCILFARLCTQGQSLGAEYIPDRPGLSPFPSRLTRGMLAIEAGYAQTSIKTETARDIDRLVPTQIRYGLLENMEINLGITYRSYDYGITKDSMLNGLGETSLGAKFRIAEEHGIYPQMECHGRLRLPYFGEDAFIPGDVEPSFDLNFLHRINERYRLTYGFGMFWRGQDENGFYGLKVSRFFNQNNGLFLEHYSYLRGNGKNEAHFSMGYLLWVNRQIQFDATIDIGAQKEITYMTISIGCSTLLTGQ